MIAKGSPSPPAPLIPQHERLWSTWNLIFILGGVLMFLIGTFILLMIPRYPELNKLLDDCIRNNPGAADALSRCRTSILNFDRIAHRAEGMNWPLLASEFLRAFGVAICIA